MSSNSVPVGPISTHIKDFYARISVLAKQINDPTTKLAIDLINETLASVKNFSDPKATSIPPGATPVTSLPTTPSNFTSTFTPNDLLLDWTSTDPSSIQFEIRVINSPTPAQLALTTDLQWEQATFVTRAAGDSAALDPLLVGTYLYLVAGMNSLGQYSQYPASLVVTVPSIGLPSLSISVIDNNVLLTWTAPTSTWAIDHYNVFQTVPGSGGPSLVGTFNGTFATIFETVSGLYLFGVEAVDIAGNVGPEQALSSQVNPPPDFDTFGTVVSSLTGEIVNGILFPGAIPRILFIVDETETWASHFTSRGWTSPESQISAGYPVYVEPGPAGGGTGSYTEVLDFGAISENVIAAVTWSVDQVQGLVNISPFLAGSTDGINFSPLQAGQSQFFASIRYLMVVFNFTGLSVPLDNDFIFFKNLQGTLSVKRVVDSGQVYASANDPSPGTPVFFNKDFKYVDSITLDVGQNSPLSPIWNFNFPLNPGTTTPFYVEVFDSAGIRVNQFVTWHARGVV